MLNPWLILAALAALAGITGGAYLKGRGDGAAVVIAKQARDDEVRMETLQLAQQGAAEAIAAIEVKNVTIKQRMEREIVEKPVFSDCKSGPDLVRQYNAIATGSPDTVADSELPAAGPAG